ncbi:MAG: serine hydrolase domain-containing protein, partial [Bacteroidota bacterium]
MKTFKIFLCLYLLLSISGFGQEEYKNLHENFDSYEEKDLFNGILLIAENGEIVFNRSIGYASFEEQIELSNDTPMPISSLTKSFTAMSIMMLAERQLLQLDEPVNKYLDNYPYPNIHIRHLLNHTAGFK